ncbi:MULTISPECIES: DUF2897 family protein [unclassified Arsukibacterium]|uniref:DUF2897 family protein n=1 Tax=unclassified Arsukibacterium TaxID=2635278 RepID=UPI000C53B193|nr:MULTISPECIES: DUF2897 family protein [unclassified Arsukibacterium]MAA94752.1 hypothetical protein [Rheinheimera sp.]MBM33890.1 hypothetical protein [Rheinheimera sp.]HAW93741.1 hypothetical protein [Candidatus Azambacteria bacterium]
MNWPLFWALLFGFGMIVGNIMLVKHSANMKMPSLKDAKETQPRPDRAANNATHRQSGAEKQNNPE